MGKLLMGREIAANLHEAVGAQIKNVREERNLQAAPVLAIVAFPGDDTLLRAELIFHEHVARTVGIDVRTILFDLKASEQEVINAIAEQNEDPAVFGVLALLPLPEHLDQEVIFAAIDPSKEMEGLVDAGAGDDIDVFDLDDPGLMVQKRSSTIRAVRLLLNSIEFQFQRSRNVFVTEDEIADNPLVARLLELSTRVNVSVAVATTRDLNVRSVTRNADLVLISVKSPEIVDDTYLKNGAVVIDFNPIMVGEKYSEEKRRRVPLLKSGVKVEAALSKAAYVAPAVGGVGPVSVASMMLNLAINYRASAVKVPWMLAANRAL